jgi:hypothetical protein
VFLLDLIRIESNLSTMADYGEPDWVNPSNETSNREATQESNIGGNITAPPQEPRSNGGLVLTGLSVFVIGLSVMMGALGVLTLIEVHYTGLTDFSEPFLAAYMILFALLLFVYELMWWQPIPWINKSLRKNFGFLYGLRGKGLYLIFVACLCLGLGKDAKVKEMNYATGAAFLLGGCLHWFIVCSYPMMAQQYVAPTSGLASRETNVV